MEKYIVVNAVSGPSPNPYVHLNLYTAQQEAARLSAQNPNIKFYVLHVVGYFQNKSATWVGSVEDETVKADCLRTFETYDFESPDEIPF